MLGYGIRQAQVPRCLKRPRSGGQNEHRFWLIGRSERMAPKQHPHGRAERHAHASPRPSRRRQNRVGTRAGASDPKAAAPSGCQGRARRRGRGLPGPVSHPQGPDSSTGPPHLLGRNRPRSGRVPRRLDRSRSNHQPASGPPVPRNPASPGRRRDGLKGDIAGAYPRRRKEGPICSGSAYPPIRAGHRAPLGSGPGGVAWSRSAPP